MLDKYKDDLPSVIIDRVYDGNMAELNREFIRTHESLSCNAAPIRGNTSIKVSTPNNWIQLVEFLDKKGVPYRYSHTP